MSELLPALMISFLPSSPSFPAQDSLLDSLHERGKVPAHLYRQYKAGELQEKYHASADLITNLSSNER